MLRLVDGRLPWRPLHSLFTLFRRSSTATSPKGIGTVDSFKSIDERHAEREGERRTITKSPKTAMPHSSRWNARPLTEASAALPVAKEMTWRQTLCSGQSTQLRRRLPTRRSSTDDPTRPRLTTQRAQFSDDQRHDTTRHDRNELRRFHVPCKSSATRCQPLTSAERWSAAALANWWRSQKRLQRPFDSQKNSRATIHSATWPAAVHFLPFPLASSVRSIAATCQSTADSCQLPTDTTLTMKFTALPNSLAQRLQLSNA